MTPLVVTAHLGNGFAASDPYSPALDGLLAYWHVREQLGADEFAASSADDTDMQPVAGLPLAIEQHDELWWYACSAPIYTEAAQHEHHYHRRFDTLAADRYLSPKKSRMDIKAGPYRNYRLSQISHVTARVRWHVIGEAAEIERLLRRCHYIGAKTAHGHGRVMRWTVAPDGDEGLARYHRPLPEPFAAAHNIDGPRLHWGFRPPARIRVNQTLCVMPGSQP